MIADTLNNLKKYEHLVPLTKEIINYLESNDIHSLSGGKHEISGDSAFVLIQEYYTVPDTEKLWESHKKYIDIQLVMEGQEYMGYSPMDFLNIKKEYSVENDVIFYENDSKEHSSINVHKNHFCIVFPEDAHKPGLHIKEVKRVKKAVIKVMV
jgi:YhcH/YjgK/YiaL family protein